MKFKLKKEVSNRKKYQQIEKNIIVLKYVIKNLLYRSHFDLNTQKKIRYIISTKVYFPSISKVKIVHRCVLTGRARVSNRILNISRIKLREILKLGLLAGAKKHSW